jgi:tetratricopeptide (TPR) repeat protein
VAARGPPRFPWGLAANAFARQDWDMRYPCLVFACLGSIVMSGCAAVGPTREAASAGASGAPADRDGDDTSYGQFLAGQSAVNHGETAVAETYFNKAAALEVGVDRNLLVDRSFTSALLAGDVPRAAAIAPAGPDADPGLRRLGALVRGVEALSSGKGKLARTVLSAPDAAASTEPAAALLIPFAAAAAGDTDASIANPTIKGQPIAQFFASLDQGKLFERAKRYDEAETAFRALIGKGDPGGIASLSLGEMLERRGRGEEAVAIYSSALARKAESPDLIAARARAQAHRPAPPLPSLRESAAVALVAPATALLADKQEEIALAYLRLALHLDPALDEAWMLVGDILTTAHEDPGARTAFAHVRSTSTQYLSARTRLAWSFQNSGDKTQALLLARETLAARPDAREARIDLADLLRVDEQYADSAKILDGVIGDKPGAADWQLLYMRAVDEEQSAHWPEAERDLQTALALRPDEPELLNFLGFSWIDRGVRLPEAMAMVQKAVTLQPQSGAMVDSLGWGYFKMGDYPAAVEKLEAAVALEPGDPDVNDHLGDAYWRVGRRVEAAFQWRRVLTLEPNAKLKAEIEAKLASGLPKSLPGAATAAVVAAAN